MRALRELRRDALAAQTRVETARGQYREAARHYLIAELRETIAERPEIAELNLSAEYDYDDEGGYFRWLSGSVTLGPDTPEADDLDDCWTEGLDVDQEVILELFGIEDVGEASLSRAQLDALASAGPQDEGGR